MSLKTEDEIKSLEKLIGQLQSLHAEISLLSKKSANDGLNIFKLKIVNGVLLNAGLILLGGYKPLESFDGFDEDALPTNSDVTMVLALYLDQIERYRSDNITYVDHVWQYLTNGKPSGIKSSMPTQVRG